MADSPKLDIWGEPEYSPHECFKCGEIYSISESTAPLDFRPTYCSLACYNKDHVLMEQSAKASPTVVLTEANNPEQESEGYTTSKIGDFILKVKRKE